MKFLQLVLFNKLTRSFLNSNSWFLQWNKRIKSVVVELWYTLSVFFPFLVIILFFKMTFSDSLETSLNGAKLFSILSFGLVLIALLNKDFFKGQSAVHRLLGYMVMDANTKAPASKTQCMLRNITAPIWPIEVAFILVSPKRRLGDFIACTILMDVKASDPETILVDIIESKLDRQTWLTLLISIIITAAILLFQFNFQRAFEQ